MFALFGYGGEEAEEKPTEQPEEAADDSFAHPPPQMSPVMPLEPRAQAESLSPSGFSGSHFSTPQYPYNVPPPQMMAGHPLLPPGGVPIAPWSVPPPHMMPAGIPMSQSSLPFQTVPQPLGMPVGYTPQINGMPLAVPQPGSADDRCALLQHENEALEQEILALKASQTESDSQKVLEGLRNNLNKTDSELNALQHCATETFNRLQSEIQQLHSQIQTKTVLAQQLENELNFAEQRQAIEAESVVNTQQSAQNEIAQLRSQNQTRDMKLADLNVQIQRVTHKMQVQKSKGRQSAGREIVNKRQSDAFIPLQPGTPLFPYKSNHPGDEVDVRLQSLFNRAASQLRVERINQGVYKFGQIQCEMRITNHKLLVKVELMEQGRAAWNNCKWGDFDRFLVFAENESFGQ